jgi:hypothetical protein
VVPSDVITTPNIGSTSGSKNTNGSVATITSGTTGNGGTTSGARAFVSMWGPLLTFNLIVEFFHEL